MVWVIIRYADLGYADPFIFFITQYCTVIVVSHSSSTWSPWRGERYYLQTYHLSDAVRITASNLLSQSRIISVHRTHKYPRSRADGPLHCERREKKKRIVRHFGDEVLRRRRRRVMTFNAETLGHSSSQRVYRDSRRQGRNCSIRSIVIIASAHHRYFSEDIAVLPISGRETRNTPSL